ncbi:MAG: hypothetical protein GY721_05520 [Deltaproteobacteria bacterium]|nr:hypothetical protein [Deltaproteobacteria bacterium]
MAEEAGEDEVSTAAGIELGSNISMSGAGGEEERGGEGHEEDEDVDSGMSSSSSIGGSGPAGDKSEVEEGLELEPECLKSDSS